jgi:hypothetical protein
MIADGARRDPFARRGGGARRRIRLAVARHRRPLALLVVLAGVWLTVRAALPPVERTTPVLVAARDLPAGRVLVAADIRTGRWPEGVLPEGRLGRAAGRTLAAPVRSGEALTDVRVTGRGLLRGQPSGTVAVAVRLADPAGAGLAQPGDRVDVLASRQPGALDSGLTDSGLTDSGATDSGATDSGATDSGVTGSGVTGSGEDRGAEESGSEASGASDSRAASRSGADAPSTHLRAAIRVARGALVLAVPGGSGRGDDLSGADTGGGEAGAADDGGGLGGLIGGGGPAGDADSTSAGVLVLAVDPAAAARLAEAQSSRSLGIAVLGR